MLLCEILGESYHMELSESIARPLQNRPADGGTLRSPPRNPERAHGWRWGNHLVSLGAAYTHGKSCQQLIKEVGGGEILRGKNLEARVPTYLTILSPPGLSQPGGP